MRELLDQIIAEIKAALRFRWHGMLAAWIACIGGWSWVAMQPDIYEASARLFVDTSSVLAPVLGNQIIAPNVDEQLAYVREALLGREQLESVARDNGLDVGAVTPQDREAVITNLRRAITIQTAGATRRTPDNIYNISYRHSERAKAIGVVEAILDRFVESTLGANRRQGDTAERFLEERIQEYEARLARADEALAAFKRENANRLPGAEGDYFQRMQAERDALAAAQRDLRILESKRDQLKEQLTGERAVVASVAEARSEPPPNSLDARIRDAQVRYDTLLLEYTERHPDVRAAREALDNLLEQRAAQLEALGVTDASQELSGLATNPVYQTLQTAIAETEVEIATLRADIAEREAKVRELQSLIDEVPEVEAQLARLTRDYDVVYQQYLALVRSRETQELSRKASDTDQIDFRVINPPSAPLSPVAPNRPMLLAIVLGGALALGGGLCYLLAQLSPVFSSAGTLRREVGLPVLGVVTHAWRQAQLAERRRATAAYVAVFAVLVLLFGGLLGLEVLGSGIHSLVEGLGT